MRTEDVGGKLIGRDLRVVLLHGAEALGPVGMVTVMPERFVDAGDFLRR
jgi:hypothetical protein